MFWLYFLYCVMHSTCFPARLSLRGSTRFSFQLRNSKWQRKFTLFTVALSNFPWGYLASERGDLLTCKVRRFSLGKLTGYKKINCAWIVWNNTLNPRQLIRTVFMHDNAHLILFVIFFHTSIRRPRCPGTYVPTCAPVASRHVFI